MNIETIKYQLKHQIEPEATVFAAFEHIEVYELKFWLANMTLEYITFIETLDEQFYNYILDDELELSKLTQFVKGSFKEVDKLFITTPAVIAEKLDVCRMWKEMLEKRMVVLTAYGEKIKMMEYILNRIEGEFGVYDAVKVDRENFVNKLMQFIIADEEPVIIQDRIKTIYAQLPVRLTKQKFFDWIEQALLPLRGVMSYEMDDYCKLITDVFYPEGVEGYGTYFIPLFEQILALDSTLGEQIKEDEAKVQFERIRQTSLYVEQAISICLSIVTMLNGLMAILFSISEKSVRDNEKEIIAFTNLMNVLATREGLEDLINEEVLSFLEKIEGVMEESLNQHMVLDAFIDMLENDYGDEVESYGLSDKLRAIIKLKELGSASYFTPQDRSGNVEEVVDDLYITHKMKMFDIKLSKVMANESRVMSRARMSNVFGMLNVIHRHTDEIRDYITFALNQCKDEAELKACYSLLTEELKQEGF